MSKFSVYELYMDGEPQPFYVGKSRDAHLRFREHVSASKGIERHLRKARKIQKALREGISINVEVVFSSEDEASALRFEVLVIKKWGRLDLGEGPLLNHTDGGDAPSRQIWSMEARKKASDRMIGSKLNLGRRRDDMVQKLSKPVTAFDEIGNIVGFYVSQKDAAFQLGCLEQSVGKCILGRLRSTKSRSGKVIQFRGGVLRTRIPETFHGLIERASRGIIGVSTITGEKVGPFRTAADAQNHTGVWSGNIGKALSGDLKSAGGYIWNSTIAE